MLPPPGTVVWPCPVSLPLGTARVGKMYKRKGSSRSSSNKKQKAHKSSGKSKDSRLAACEAEFGSIGDYGQDAWNELNQEVVENLSKTVVSVASFIGNQMHFGCTGIVVRSNESGVGILTSASLVRSLDGNRDMTSMLTIEVRLPNEQFTGGIVVHYDFHYNVAVIIIPPFPGFRVACFDLHMEFGSHSKVVAVGRWFSSGKFMAATGILTDEPNGLYPEHLGTACPRYYYDELLTCAQLSTEVMTVCWLAKKQL